MGLHNAGSLRAVRFSTLTMVKSRLKIWAERQALAITARFFLTFLWPMAFVALAAAALVLLIVLIAALPDVAVA